MSKVVPSAFKVHGVKLSLGVWQSLRSELVEAVKSNPLAQYGPGHGNPKDRCRLFDQWLDEWLDCGICDMYFNESRGSGLIWKKEVDKPLLRLLIKGEILKIANGVRRQAKLQQVTQIEEDTSAQRLLPNEEQDSAGNIWHPLFYEA